MSKFMDIKKTRPLAFEDGGFLWNIHRVPLKLPDGETAHPARTSAIFVVHGIGQQHWTETASQLRAGFEDAFEDIAEWQHKNPQKLEGVNQTALPPPFIYEGFWANYDDVKDTFPEDWKFFNDREQKFFSNLWKERIVSGARSIAWMIGQQLRLLHPKVLIEVGMFAWILYWPLQIVSSTALLYAWFRNHEVITGFVNDVRLYLDPRGVVERAIVQRIDDRIGGEFLKLIGLDWDFRPLPAEKWVEVGGGHLAFDRVVWVAHSLGTVINYNVFSALFHKGLEIDTTGDDEQKAGVELFRNALCRFVTMGSPLDKVAFLFKDKSIRPWPDSKRRALVRAGEKLENSDPSETEWWINFYHVFDPVSGSLGNPFICGNQPPSNLHIHSCVIPGYAHVAYWADPSTLRCVELVQVFRSVRGVQPWSGRQILHRRRGKHCLPSA